MRVTTNYQNQVSLKRLQESNEKLALSSYQITSGYKADSLSALSGDAYSLLSMKNVSQNTKSFMDNIDKARTTLTSTESALNQLADLITRATTIYTTGRNENSAETRAALAPEAAALAESFYNVVNTDVDGTYIFAGSNGANPPISGAATATEYPGDPLPRTYYLGDSRQQQVLTAPNNTQSYGITGDEDAFAYIKSGLEALMFGLENNDVTEIDNAVAALDNAKDGIASLLGQAGGQLNNFNLIKERHETQQVFLTEQISSIEKADVTQALTEFTQQSAVLEASMATMTRMNQLTLLDYL